MISWGPGFGFVLFCRDKTIHETTRNRTNKARSSSCDFADRFSQQGVCTSNLNAGIRSPPLLVL